MKSHCQYWDKILLEALWSYRTTWKSTTNFSPYELIYGKIPIFPIELKLKTLRTYLEVNLDLNEAQKDCLEQLNELDEFLLATLHHTSIIQQKRKKWYDHFIKKKEFQKGDWALLYDSRFKYFKGKLCTRWLGPYQVDTIFDNGTV